MIDVEAPPELGGARSGREGAGVRHQDVEASQCLSASLHPSGQGLGIGDIDGLPPGLDAGGGKGGDRFIDRPFMTRADADSGPLMGEGKDDGAANPARPPGHQSPLSRQS